MNNELIAVESLIDRLSRGAKTEGAPVSYDDMLASKLEAISTPFETSAKARRLGKQSSFERLRALRARRAAPEEATAAAPKAPKEPTNPNPNPTLTLTLAPTLTLTLTLTLTPTLTLTLTRLSVVLEP